MKLTALETRPLLELLDADIALETIFVSRCVALLLLREREQVGIVDETWVVSQVLLDVHILARVGAWCALIGGFGHVVCEHVLARIWLITRALTYQTMR